MADEPNPKKLEELEKRVHSGSNDALDEFYARVKPIVERSLRRFKLEDEEQAVNDAFFKLILMLRKNELKPSTSLTKLLLKIALLEAVDQRREIVARKAAPSHERLLFQPSRFDDPYDKAILNEAAEIMVRALSTLTAPKDANVGLVASRASQGGVSEVEARIRTIRVRKALIALLEGERKKTSGVSLIITFDPSVPDALADEFTSTLRNLADGAVAAITSTETHS